MDEMDLVGLRARAEVTVSGVETRAKRSACLLVVRDMVLWLTEQLGRGERRNRAYMVLMCPLSLVMSFSQAGEDGLFILEHHLNPDKQNLL